MDQVSFTAPTDIAATPAFTMIEPAGGTSLWVLGILVTIKIFANETGGAYSLFEDIIPPGASPPPHIHTQEVETWYVRDGELEWNVGDKTFLATKGSFIHLPKNVPHAFVNKSGKWAHMVLSYAPGGFEKWFVEVGDAVEDRDAPGDPPPVTGDMVKKAIELGSKDYGMVFMGHEDVGEVHHSEL